ncbi:hypothetical protein [Aquirufa nivalisilvae]
MEHVQNFKKEKLCEELREHLLVRDTHMVIKNKFVNQLYRSNPDKKTTINGLMNYSYQYKLNSYNEYFKEGDYDSVVFLVIERPWRLQWIDENKEMIINEKGAKYYYELLGEAYNDTENAHENKEKIIELFHFGKSPKLMMNEDEQSEFETLPQKFKVWRGVGVNDEFEEDLIGSSWTTDYNRAVFFAERNVRDEDGYPLIFGLEIDKEDVLSLITRRNENEVILDYSKIKEDNLEHIYI